MILVCALASVLAYFGEIRDANAVPSFARKYKTSCLTCHTVYPVLNPFGEAFRRNGYRMPSQDKSVDSDSVKAEVLPLGQEEYKKTFPQSVWPDVITQDVPLSAMVNGGVAFNFPNSDAHDANGNTFTWAGITTEAHLFAAGAFSDTITYFAQLTVADGGIDIETSYLLWNDVVGPSHLVNLWVGRLMSPSLTSFGGHSSYVADNFFPATSIAALYNPSGTFSLGLGHTDGVEVNGIAGHRVGYALGWVASSVASGLKQPTAEDLYAHIGVKIGGMSLDGEGPSGMQTQNALRPWSETSLTLDVFGYHGMSKLDAGTSAELPPVPEGQNDAMNVIGGSGRFALGSLLITGGAQWEKHAHPYPGVAGMPAAPPVDAVPGVPSLTSATAFTQYDEIDYVVYPWLVPGVRAEYTHLGLTDGSANLLRLIPGIAFLVRPNIRAVLSATFERAHGVAPTGSWGAAGGNIVAPAGANSMLEAEQINASVAWAF